MEKMISIEKVTKKFKDIIAVDEISLHVPKGSIYGLVGSDGAGKSTLLRMTATMIPPDTGRITIAGHDLAEERKPVKNIIGYMPQRFGLYSDLTVFENIDFFANIFGVRGKEKKKRIERYLSFSNLTPYMDRLAGNLSGGMKQKLGLACVLVHHPHVLILDEPTNGVDPVSRYEFWEILFQMRDEGMTLLISTAYLDEGEKCDCLVVMHDSKIINRCTPEEIRASHENIEEAVIDSIRKADGKLEHDTFKH